MKRIFTLVAIVVPTLVGAQAPYDPQPTMNGPNYTTSIRDALVYAPAGDTPTMKRQRLARAIALRREAAALLAADGGSFTLEHQAYVQRKARAILSYGR